ncbi:diacylglycerol kinase family protein [Flavicella sediminum]|uniref:diacylglycerol kinase family protein n=1 Tax=Flavicella sediminum TaxID=2585141 RepID=UPI00112292F9|nr:diacylglycerol kinase family protein [Flavicella sediminum]
MKDPNDSFIVDRIKSIRYAFKGMWILISSESSIKAQLFISLCVSILGFVMEISPTEWMFQIIAIGLVITTEAMNTAVEKVANFVQPDFDKRIGVIKDIAAGAVAFASLVAMAIALVIYLPKFI